VDRPACTGGGTVSGPAVRQWDVTVLPDVIDATTEGEARSEFIMALVEDGSLIYVSEHRDEDVDETVNP